MKSKLPLFLIIFLSVPLILSLGTYGESILELEDGSFEIIGHGSEVGNLINEDFDEDKVVATYVNLKKEDEVNSFVFNDESGYVSIKDDNGKENIFGNIEKGGKLEIDNQGKLIGADFITGEEGGVYSFGGNEIEVPAKTHVIFKNGKIDMIIPKGEELEEFPKSFDNSEEYIINIKSEGGEEIILPNGYSLQQGELSYKKGNIFLEKGKSVKINGFLVDTKEDLPIRFYKGFFKETFSKFFGSKGPENFVNFYEDKIVMSNQGSDDLFDAEFSPGAFIGKESKNPDLQEIKIPKKGYYDYGDKNNDVKLIQKLVGTNEDGIYGPETKKAVKIWQRKNGIKVDGLFGSETLSTALGFDSTKTIKISPLGGKAIISKDNNGIEIDLNRKSIVKIGTKELDIEGDKEVYKKVQRELAKDLSIPVDLRIRGNNGEESIELDYNERGDFTYRDVKNKGRSINGKIYTGLVSLAEPTLNSLGFKEKSPYSSHFLSYFFSGKGGTIEMNNIPSDWKDWIIRKTNGENGVHEGINAYNSPIFDLRNSLGHFQVTVEPNDDGTKTYKIEDTYAFGYKEDDAVAQEGRHGFPVGELSESRIKFLNKYILPSKMYQNPGGFEERFEIKEIGGVKYLFIPQQWLNERGREFKVESEFIA